MAPRGVRMDGRRHAVGREDRDRVLGDLVAQLVDEDGAALAQLLDDVLVVDDLLAHVDRRTVELERALDGLHGPVDARAVAARGGEEELLGSGHRRAWYEVAARVSEGAAPTRASSRSPHPLNERQDRLPDRVERARRGLIDRVLER